MELLTNLGGGLSYVFGVVPILTIVLGVAMGIIAGATPGLSPSMGVALLVPFTYAMSPTLALLRMLSSRCWSKTIDWLLMCPPRQFTS